MMYSSFQFYFRYFRLPLCGFSLFICCFFAQKYHHWLTNRNIFDDPHSLAKMNFSLRFVSLYFTPQKNMLWYTDIDCCLNEGPLQPLNSFVKSLLFSYPQGGVIEKYPGVSRYSVYILSVATKQTRCYVEHRIYSLPVFNLRFIFCLEIRREKTKINWNAQFPSGKNIMAGYHLKFKMGKRLKEKKEL